MSRHMDLRQVFYSIALAAARIVLARGLRRRCRHRGRSAGIKALVLGAAQRNRVDRGMAVKATICGWHAPVARAAAGDGGGASKSGDDQVIYSQATTAIARRKYTDKRNTILCQLTGLRSEHQSILGVRRRGICMRSLAMLIDDTLSREAVTKGAKLQNT
jgi:hypothetical protein